MILENTASPHDWIEMDLRRPTPWLSLVAALMLGVLLGTGVPALAERAREWVAPASAAAEVSSEWRSRTLPSEWRWSPPKLEVDHMFRSHAELNRG